MNDTLLKTQNEEDVQILIFSPILGHFCQVGANDRLSCICAVLGMQ